MLTYDIFQKTSDDYIYSIDNLRISFNLGDRFDMFVNLFTEYNDNKSGYDLVMYQSGKMFHFEYLFTFRSDDKSKSFTIGFSHEGKHNFKHDGFIDFNPNKVGEWDIFKKFYNDMLQFAHELELTRYDLAIDIPVERDVVKLVKDRRSYHYLKDRSVTEYLGKRSNHNYIKIYDKKIESKLDYPLTRVEITVDPNEKIIFPDIRLKQTNSGVNIIDLNVTDRVIFEMCLEVSDPFQYIMKLSPRKKAMFKQLLSDDFKPFQFEPIVNLQLLDKVKEKYINRKYDINASFIPDIDLPWM